MGAVFFLIEFRATQSMNNQKFSVKTKERIITHTQTYKHIGMHTQMLEKCEGGKKEGVRNLEEFG